MAEQESARKKLYVSHKDESPRLFKSDFVDFFSRIPYWVPMVIYIPVIVYFSYAAFAVHNLTFWQYIGLFAAGVVVWSITEYLLHRFVFHFHPKSELGKRIHFIAHGVHHDYPNDSMRLVLPPSISVPLAALFYGIFYLIFGNVYCGSFFAGFVLGYLLYDELHYATHHANWNTKFFQHIKKHHMKHHYQDPDKGFGVSSDFWDIIFRSGYKTKNK